MYVMIFVTVIGIALQLNWTVYIVFSTFHYMPEIQAKCPVLAQVLECFS